MDGAKTQYLSFKYSIIFHCVIGLDLLISVLFGLTGLSLFFEIGSPSYHNPISILLGLILLINLILDGIFLNYERKDPRNINYMLCLVKCIFSFFGILTLISFIYFLIISARMHSAYKKTIRSENPIRCSKCYMLITDDTAKYCPHCGAKIENEISPVLIDTQNQQKTIDNRKSTQLEPTEKPSNPHYTGGNAVPDGLIKKEQNVSQKIPYEIPTNRSVSAMKTKPEEVARTIVRPHPVLIIKSVPSNSGESIPLEDKSIFKEPIQDSELIDYTDAAKSLKKLDDFFEDVKPLKDQESVQNNDEFDKDNLPHQISILPVDTTTDQEPDNDRSLTGESIVKFPSVGPDNTASSIKDIDFSITQESEETVHSDPDYISIDWGEVEQKRREHNNNKSKMEVILGQHDDVLSDEIELTSSPPKEKPAINQNQGYDLQFPSDPLKRLDSRYYPVLKNIEGLTEISTENFTKILIQCNLGAISLTPTLDDINEWAEEVLNFENPLLEIQENTIRINMR